MIKVLVVDDEQPIRAALQLLIDSESDLKVVGHASNGDEGVEQAISLKPDVILMDVQMPKMDGLAAAEMLCAIPGGPRIIMLTVFDVDEYVYAALRAGASGFLLKNSEPAAVLSAIRAAHDGSSLFAPEITKRLVAKLAPKKEDQRLRCLTERERETLILIGRGLSNNEIACELFVTPTTVRTYVSRILTKIGARDRAQLVVIAYENGLVAH